MKILISESVGYRLDHAGRQVERPLLAASAQTPCSQQQDANHDQVALRQHVMSNLYLSPSLYGKHGIIALVRCKPQKSGRSAGYVACSQGALSRVISV